MTPPEPRRLDPDPLDVQEQEEARWRFFHCTEADAEPRRLGCSIFAFLLAAILLAGCSAQPAGNATPRTAPDSPAQSGAPLRSVSPAERDALLAHRLDFGSGAPPLTPEVLAGGTTPITGTASWYAARGDVASVPWWRFGMEPRWAVVSRFADGRTYTVTVLVVGFCQCHVGRPDERVIDLSLSAFRQLHRPDIPDPGLLKVTIELTGAGPGLPATDQEEGP